MTEPSVVVAERSRRVDLMWGFLTVVFAAALVRGHAGAGSTGAPTAIDLIFGVLTAGSIAAWVWFRRHPARLEVTPEAVVFAHSGQRGATRLAPPGELSIRTKLMGGKNPVQFLELAGTDLRIPMATFDHDRVQAACRANGWRFAGDA